MNQSNNMPGSLMGGALGQQSASALSYPSQPPIKVGQVWHVRLNFDGYGSRSGQLHTLQIAEITERTVLLVDPPPPSKLAFDVVRFDSRFDRGSVGFIELASESAAKVAE